MKLEKPTQKERFEHILKAIRLIYSFAENHTEKSFLNDAMALSATMYQCTIISEALSNIEKRTLEKYDYPWHKVKAFRNFILHEYHAIEDRVIWDTTKQILPGLMDLIEKIIKNEF
jgi:uncharacterized protein with HEPN domain